jgi:hypothetical protein
MPVHHVTADVKERLDVANAVIHRVRQLLVHGQANQVRGYGQMQGDTVQAQAHNAALQNRYAAVEEGWQHLQVQKTSYLYGWYVSKTTSLGTSTDVSNVEHPQRVAGIALHMQVGNCQEFASVSYLLLRANLSTADRVVYVNGQGPHWYCLVTDPGVTINSNQDVPDDAVVVDPWIACAQPEALLWTHSAHQARYPVVLVGISKPGKGATRNAGTLDEGKAQSAMQKYSTSMVSTLVTSNHGSKKPGPSWGTTGMSSRVGRFSGLWDEQALWSGQQYTYALPSSQPADGVTPITV